MRPRCKGLRILPALVILATACTSRPDVLWAPSLEHVYAFKILRLVRNSAIAAPALDVRVHATLHVVPHAAVEGRQRLDLSIRETRVFGAHADRHAADLQRRYQVELRDDTVTGLYVEPGTGPAAVSLVRTLASVLQLSRPRSQDRAHYDAVEHDSIGRYVVRYDRTAPGQVSRTKQRYEALFDGAFPMSIRPESLQVMRSTSSMDLHEGAIASLNLEEGIALKSNAEWTSATKVNLGLRRQSEGVEPKAVEGLVYVPADVSLGDAHR